MNALTCAHRQCQSAAITRANYFFLCTELMTSTAILKDDLIFCSIGVGQLIKINWLFIQYCLCMCVCSKYLLFVLKMSVYLSNANFNIFLLWSVYVGCVCICVCVAVFICVCFWLPLRNWAFSTNGKNVHSPSQIHAK